MSSSELQVKLILSSNTFIQFCLVHFMVIILTIFTIYVVTAAEAYGLFEKLILKLPLLYNYERRW
jgi:hypothetical protein